MTDETPSNSPINGGEQASQATPPFMEGPGEVELQQQCEEYLAGWKRALADYENLQRQNAQAREEDRRRVRVNMAHELLPVIDNFDQAMRFAPSDMPSDMKNWFAGVEHIARQFAEVMKSIGVEPIDALGKPFDPNLHESGGSRHEDDKPEHVVLEEVIKGWKLGDLVLRPAKVIINE